MALRSLKERIFQVLLFEAGGIAMVSVLYAAVFSKSAGHSLGLLFTLSVIVTLWAVFHNTVFDFIELKACGRPASARPHGLRIAHATCLEVSSVALTLPVVMALGGHGFWEAISINISLTLFYTGYAYLFYLAYDWVKPIETGEMGVEAPVIGPAQVGFALSDGW